MGQRDDGADKDRSESLPCRGDVWVALDRVTGEEDE